MFDFLNLTIQVLLKTVTKLMRALIHARFRFLELVYPGYIRILVNQRTEKTEMYSFLFYMFVCLCVSNKRKNGFTIRV